jgi:prepilin signal peptidase PulO-like enzyme (type II secretory pathway)
MWVIIISVVVGLVVGRGIVAETSAHRLGLPDNWLHPECSVCGSGLTPLMVHCSEARHRQPWSTTTVSIVNAGVFGLMAWAVPGLAVLPAFLVFGGTMVILTVTDLQTKLIPNRILGPATAIGIILLTTGSLITGNFTSLGTAALGGFAYFGVLFVLGLIARGALGFGDVKMSFIIGVFAGYVSLGSVVIAGLGAFIVAGVVSVALIVTRVSNRKDMIPFGPFMTATGIIAVVWGPVIVNWYLR